MQLAERSASRQFTVAAPRDARLDGRVCRRALEDGDCPFSHDWRSGGSPDNGHRGDIPYVRSGHDVRTLAELRSEVQSDLDYNR